MPDPREWSPRRRVKPEPKLEALASDVIGDEKDPNLFFVTIEGTVVLVTMDFNHAYSFWKEVSMSERMSLKARETSLEDRKSGVIASVEPMSDKRGAPLIRYDDSETFGYR